MKTLPKRLVHVCLCASATYVFLSNNVSAGGNGSLFSAEAALFGAANKAQDLLRPEPLLYAGVEPVKIENGPEQIFLARSQPRYSGEDLNCLAEALYHEARGEGAKGQAAVAEVILNRVDSRAFPGTVCGVVNQPSQFSYTIGGRKPIREKGAYLRARAIAETALAGAPRALTKGATYFHTPAVRPAWSRRFQRTVQIGRHIFYRRGQRVASN
ncbi:cell wall hydrolase [Paracoccus sp. Z330]|uniref:Cell wall hydrolase n=1 Tax=Paracoccus onchidii TaxID=3017813 RepID=A0ABT4ZCE5_9RHOB|nr:cell wall hydrolase [Paracoccus onchidii]MDB6177039.1 cell wall hydrolase [Paracoccus onchidii]